VRVQFSLFGAAAVEPSVGDLDGVLLAGGHWARNGGTARLSVVVDAQWRADALCGIFTQLGVGGGDEEIVSAAGGLAVRTSFSPWLAAHAARWTRGANAAVPHNFALGPVGLRIWAITAGHRDAAGYLLATGERPDAIHPAAGAQLAKLGLTAVSLTHRAGGPAWRIISAKRLRRLAELLGEPPSGAATNWPC
jgi:hypothetical protein